MPMIDPVTPDGFAEFARNLFEASHIKINVLTGPVRVFEMKGMPRARAATPHSMLQR
jgi:hypothetical protein